ncbi:SPOR domain-containing protein [Roseomonas harenae]|uniref:SPOR domain-containing protein n=1 Tax=Muricoccus harenae TaxID=2692566 RepID=UPI0013313965|nr:SPOR domain-containing protein [Roseomonas harenae]
MSDFTVPSYRVRPQRAGFQLPWRMLAIAGAVVGVAAVGGGIVWSVTRAMNSSVPTIEADARPIRVKPDDPGGLRVANQDERIFESQRRSQAGSTPPQARLTPEPERPDLAALRQAAARAQQAAAPTPPAAAPAAQADSGPVRPPLVNPSLGQQQPGRSPAPAEQHQAQQEQPQVPAISPPPMPANAPSPAVPARTGRFVVQLGAVTSEEAARGEWTRLQGRIPELAGRQPQITRVDRGDQPPLWRIRTSGLPDAAAARGLCDSAKSKGAPCAVIGG